MSVDVQGKPSKVDQIRDILRTPEGWWRSNEDIAETVGADIGHVRRVRREDGIVLVPLQTLTILPELQMRPGLVASVVTEYAEAFDSLPPIGVVSDGTTYWAFDGFHRIRAAREIDRAEIPATIIEGDYRRALAEAIAANPGHGLKRCPETKRNAVLAVLKDAEWSKEPISEIARRAAVDWRFADKVVKAYREELARSGAAVPEGPKTVRRGDQTYQVDTAKMVANREAKIAARGQAKADDETPARNGKHKDIPDDAVVTDVVVHEQPDDELSDEAWLEENCPIRHKAVKVFADAEALVYRRLQKHMRTFLHHARMALPKGLNAGGGTLIGAIRDLIRIQHPRDWKLCLRCNGSGTIGPNQFCGQCRQRGYISDAVR